MDYLDYLWVKAIILIILAFVGNFLYTFFTGRSLEEARTDKEAEQNSHSTKAPD